MPASARAREEGAAEAVGGAAGAEQAGGDCRGLVADQGRRAGAVDVIDVARRQKDFPAQGLAHSIDQAQIGIPVGRDPGRIQVP